METALKLNKFRQLSIGQDLSVNKLTIVLLKPVLKFKQFQWEWGKNIDSLVKTLIKQTTQSKMECPKFVNCSVVTPLKSNFCQKWWPKLPTVYLKHGWNLTNLSGMWVEEDTSFHNLIWTWKVKQQTTLLIAHNQKQVLNSDGSHDIEFRKMFFFFLILEQEGRRNPFPQSWI